MHVLFTGRIDVKTLKSEEFKVVEESLKEKDSEIAKLREEIEAMQAREAEKEPVDDILSKLISDPEVQRLLRKKLEGF
jgi:uncharacterized protein YjgD (DUF1641 family)